MQATHHKNGLFLENVSYKKKDKTILSNVSAFFPSGEITAIIGPSGCGKSSLLDVISKRARSKKEVSGKIYFKGEQLTKNKFQKLGGYVFQEDILLATDSIHEVLMEASILKLDSTHDLSPGNWTNVWKDRKQRVMRIEKDMHLYNCRNVIVGDGGLKKGASGGQRRRVSISIQLINNPDLLLLDEYSSGLDSYTAFEIGKNLRQLTKEQGKTIISTIHQPSSELFSLFDNVMVLSGGKLIFFGSCSIIREYLNSIEYPLPSDTNPSDWFLSVTSNPYLKKGSGQLGGSIMESKLSFPSVDSMEMVDVVVDNGNNNKEEKQEEGKQTLEEELKYELEKVQQRMSEVSEFYYNTFTKRGIYCPQSINDFEIPNVHSEEGLATATPVQTSMTDLEVPSPKPKKKKTPITFSIYSFLIKLIVLTWRSFRTTFRNPLIFWSEFIQSVFLGFFTGLLYFRLDNDQQGITDRISAFFFLLAIEAFIPAMSVISVFPSQQALFVRERESNLYSTLNYYLGYTFVHTPLEMLFPTIMLLCCFWITGFASTAGNFFIILAILILVQWWSESLGLLLGALFKSVDLANLVLSAVVTVWMTVGGFLVKTDNIGYWFYPFSYTSAFKYSLQALSQTEFATFDKFKCPAADPSLLQSLDMASLCDFSNLTIPVGTVSGNISVPLQNYSSLICSNMNWNSTMQTYASIGCLTNEKQIIANYFPDKIPIWGNILILFALFLILRVLIYFALWNSGRSKR
ncbi:hypothetical protein ABK040_013519 [Willaertia magna]